MDVVGGINDRGQTNLWNLSIDPFGLPEDTLGNLDGVLPRLLSDRQANPGQAVDPDDPGDLFPGVLDAGDLLELDGSPFTDGYHRIAKLIQAGVFPRGTDHHPEGSPVYRSCRDIDVSRSDSAEDLVDRQAEGFNLVGVEIYMNFSVETAEYIKSGYAWHAFDTVLDLIVDNLTHLHRVQFACRTKDEDGKTGQVEFSQPRSLRLIR